MKIQKSHRQKNEHSSDYLKSICNLKSNRNFKHSVAISLIDGTSFILPCYYVEDDPEFFFVIEEHHGRFCFEKELIAHCSISEL